MTLEEIILFMETDKSNNWSEEIITIRKALNALIIISMGNTDPDRMVEIASEALT